ncbi:hypothetical protein GF327_04135 [Candidatus Woesearchaeota archaeon]|nr:hypothetical protein [Candidatus Woesearchaeota archaeon]
MGTMSVSVPDDLRDRMNQLDEVNWSAVARKAFEAKVKEIDILKKISSKSSLSDKDVKEISRKINEKMAKKFRSI